MKSMGNDRKGRNRRAAQECEVMSRLGILLKGFAKDHHHTGRNALVIMDHSHTIANPVFIS